MAPDNYHVLDVTVEWIIIMCSILFVVNITQIPNCFLLVISTQAIHIITSFNHEHMIHLQKHLYTALSVQIYLVVCLLG